MSNKEVTTKVVSNGVYGRRQRALARLKSQLKEGTKSIGGFPLEEKDITRIKKEIAVLESRQ